MRLYLLIALLIISFFNCYSQDTIRLFLDKNFSETQKESASILRLILKKDNNYIIKDQIIDGKVICDCEYSSINPMIANGSCRHYNENGKIYSSGKYSENRLSGIWIYYSDEKNDTVDYNLADNYLRSININCKVNHKALKKDASLFEAQKLIEDIKFFLQNEIHLPSRYRDIDTNYKNIIYIVVNKDGYIDCPIFEDTINTDLKYEILRLLLSYRNKDNLKSPLNIAIPIDFNILTNSKRLGLWFVDENATFQGGDLDNFSIWVQSQIEYPSEAAIKGITGKVIIQYSIDSDGSVCDINIIRTVNPLLDNEVIRVIKKSPKWKPAIKDGLTVKQNFVIPITFSLK
jgi:TonB family protein